MYVYLCWLKLIPSPQRIARSTNIRISQLIGRYRLWLYTEYSYIDIISIFRQYCAHILLYIILFSFSFSFFSILYLPITIINLINVDIGTLVYSLSSFVIRFDSISHYWVSNWKRVLYNVIYGICQYHINRNITLSSHVCRIMLKRA